MCENQLSIVKCLENLSESLVCCLTHSTLCKHIVTHTTEDKKLLFTVECICLSTSADDLEHLTLRGDHSSRSDS